MSSCCFTVASVVSTQKYAISSSDALHLLARLMLCKSATEAAELIEAAARNDWLADCTADAVLLTTRCRRRLTDNQWSDCWKVEYGTSSTPLITETVPMEVGIIGDMMRAMIWPSKLDVATRLLAENAHLRARIARYESLSKHYGHNLIDINRAVKQASNALDRFARV